MTTNLRSSCFKFYKKQSKSENYETCQDVKISYVEAVIKIEEVPRKLSRTILTNRRISEEVSRFREEGDEVVSIVRDKLARNLLNFFITASTYDMMTSQHVLRFSVFVCFFIEFKNNSTASSWSCFVNKMFEIGGLFLEYGLTLY